VEFPLVSVPLARKTPAGTYLQAVTNGKGPYKIVNDGWLSFVRTTTLSEAGANPRYYGAVASFDSPDIKPRAVRLRAYFQPVIIQDDRFPAADYGGILIGDSPDYTSGLCSITLPCGTKGTASVLLGTVYFPAETNIFHDFVLPGSGIFNAQHKYPFRFELFYPGENTPRDGISDFMPVCEDPFLYASVRAGKDVGNNFLVPGADSWPSSEPPGLVAYDATRTLTIGSNSLIVTSAPYKFYPPGQGDATGFPSSHQAAVTLSCQAIDSHQPGEPCRLTLWLHRGGSEVQVFAASHAGFTHGNDRPTWATTGYTNAPIKHVDGQRITITRNGTTVLSGVRPSDESVAAATGEDGSYLIVSEVDQASDPEDAPAARQAKFLKDFASFVVDTRRPVVGWCVPDDVYESTNTISARIPHVYCSEPFVRTPGSLPVNQYTITGSVPGTVTVTGFAADTVSDYAGNRPESDGEHEITVHADPQYNHFGPISRLVVPLDPRNGEQDPWHSRRSVVSTVRLQFDRVVNVSQVTAEQVTLTKDGETINGCAITPHGDGREWMITVPAEEQSPRSWWVLTYDPAGEVTSDDIITRHISKRSRFPEPLFGNFRVIYVDDETGKHYRKTQWNGAYNANGQAVCDYEEIQPGEFPVDQYGHPYAEEPSVLAARAAWLMADDVPVPQLIDTSATQHYQAIGRVVSVGKDSTLSDATDVAVETTDGMFLETDIVNGDAANTDEGIIGLGTFRTAEVKGFVPRVPPLTDPPARCGYFGIGTTIDPCPPGRVSECAAPTVGQPHSSAIISDEDITEFSATIVSRGEDGSEIESDEPVYLTGGDTAFPSLDSEGYPANQPEALPIAAYFADTFSFGDTLSGKQFSQNTWQATATASSGSVRIKGDYQRDDQGGIVTGDDGKPLYVDATQAGTTLTGTITQDQMYAVATAFRCAKEFPAMKTTTLGELVMVIRFRMLCKASLHRETVDGDGNVINQTDETKRAFRGFTASCIFSKEQEADFSAGTEVYFPVENYWVKLQKA
jgi:hypothetical protein